MRLIISTCCLAALAACDTPPLETVPGIGASSDVPGLRVATQDMPALCRAEAADKYSAFGAAISLQPAVPVSTGWVVNGVYRRSTGDVPIACNFNQQGALVSVSDLPDPTFDGVTFTADAESAF